MILLVLVVVPRNVLWFISLFLGEWEFREAQQDEETQLPVERIGTKNSRRDMFRAELRLIEYPGNAPYSVLFEGGKGGLAIMHHDDFFYKSCIAENIFNQLHAQKVSKYTKLIL